nr:TIGR01458 family HAD-type hydrolase [Calditrichia bacterium]
MPKASQKSEKPDIRGFLIDIDGVLYVEKQVIEGAVETLNYLQREKIPFLLVTNTTRRSRYSLLTNLNRMGFKISLDQIFSAPFAAAQWLKANKATSICLFAQGDTYREFKDFRNTTHNPQYVLIGDLGEDLTYEMLNQAFRLLMDGSELVALQKNRYWRRSSGLAIDSGAIVAGLEYAAHKEARIIGKPSPDFFEQAFETIGLPAQHLAIIGDDLEADIDGGAAAGLFT